MLFLIDSFKSVVKGMISHFLFLFATDSQLFDNLWIHFQAFLHLGVSFTFSQMHTLELYIAKVIMVFCLESWTFVCTI